MFLTLTPLRAHRALPTEFLALSLAYLRLLAACWEAREAGLDPDARPVRVESLRLDGLCDRRREDMALLWPLYHHHVEHLQPVLVPGASHTAWQRIDSLLLLEASCFWLTRSGEAFAEWFLASALSADPGEFEAAWDALQVGPLTPRYDQQERVFHWGRHVLKHFRQPSPSQELVLCTAEELGWEAWFDDPLPRAAGGNPKLRLHDTIKNLNRFQGRPLIRFRGDGTGTRIGWEYR